MSALLYIELTDATLLYNDLYIITQENIPCPSIHTS